MKRLLPFILLVLLGTGCLPVPPTPEERAAATEALLIEEGKTYTLETTVFGLGGFIPQWFGRAEMTNVKVVAYGKGAVADLSWTRGEKTGMYRNVSLDSTDHFILPAGFQEGDASLSGTGTSLLILSRSQYDALAKGEGAVLNLGLFDETFSSTIGLTDKAKNALAALKQESDESHLGEQAITITPAPDRGTYTLSVSGKKITVDTIEAQNWFGHYTILANREHPLVLRVVLSPAARGVSNASTNALIEAGLGYHVTKIE